MNVKGRTETTYSITDMTEQQARDVLNVCVAVQMPEFENEITLDQQETLNNMRQALLASGLQRGEQNADTKL